MVTKAASQGPAGTGRRGAAGHDMASSRRRRYFVLIARIKSDRGIGWRSLPSERDVLPTSDRNVGRRKRGENEREEIFPVHLVQVGRGGRRRGTERGT